jgi:broad specificity phosphatase PhoE
MGTLFLVRHGQASFGADDYDNLSALGLQQSVRLGEYWRSKGLRFDAALVGTLKRQTQTLGGILQGLQLEPSMASGTQSWPGLNEYDSKAVIEAIHPGPLQKPDTPELYRQHFRILRDGLTQWMNGVVSPKGMPSYQGFLQGVTSALDHVRSQHNGNVLIVSSGGPISTAVGHILGTTPEATIELNLRIRNTSVTELSFTPKRHMLVTYNTLPHLDSAEHANWVTYS